VVVVAAFVGCSATSTVQFTSAGPSGSSGEGASGPSGTGPSGTGGSTGTNGMGGGIGFDAGPSGGTGGGGPGCSAASELVYVFATDNTIWSFDPPTKQFTFVAMVDCATTLSPNSMAIDRNLVAWLNYEDGVDGNIFRFDLKVKSGCTQTPIVLPSGFEQVGMGFSSDTPGGSSETLYVDGIGGAGLARVDMSNNTVVPIGTFGNDPNLIGQSAELTGTGDARLFGYFTTDPVRVAQLDKATGQAINDFPLNGVSPPSDWAFSFWGGDFYLYAAPGDNSTGNSSVIHYSPSSMAVDPSYVPDVGFTIIGAGVSTCAPLKPPN
jgi:hypothetical protein